jgi:L-lysine exporter family protein LysE/ArgO
MLNIVSTWLAGFGMMAGLIVAIGAQNAFVLKQGLMKSHVPQVVILTVLIDSVMISVGAFGFGAWISSSPVLLRTVSAGGAIFLIWYGLNALYRAFRHEVFNTDTHLATSQSAALRSVLAVSFLNPHAYLDTVVLFGGYAAQYKGIDRLVFTLGAISLSFTWFVSIGFGARYLIPIFQKRMAWIALEILIALIMFRLSWKFATVALGWNTLN